MAVDLLEMVQQGLSPSFANMASGLFGESAPATNAALRALVPTVLAGVARKGVSESGAQSVLSMLNNPSVDTSLLGNLGGIFAAGGAQANAMMGAGSSIASSLFGDKVVPLASALSSLTGLAKPQSAGNLIGMVVPIVLAFLKRHVADGKLNAGDLAMLLGAQGEYLEGALDRRLTGALGYADPSAMVAGLSAKAGDATRAASNREIAAASKATSMPSDASAPGGSLFARWWPWLVGAVVVLFILSRLMAAQRGTEPTPAVVTTPVPAAVSAPSPAALTTPTPEAAVMPAPTQPGAATGK